MSLNPEKMTRKSFYPKEGVVAIAVVATLYDSAISDVDIDRVVNQLWNTGLFYDYSGDELLTMVERFLDIAEEEGLGVLLNAAYASLSDDIAPEAFAIGVMMLVDDSEEISTQKKGFLQELQQALRLKDEQAQQIIGDAVADLNAAG